METNEIEREAELDALCDADLLATVTRLRKAGATGEETKAAVSRFTAPGIKRIVDRYANILSEVEERNAREEARKQRGDTATLMDSVRLNECEAADFGSDPRPMTRAKVEAVADWLAEMPGINYAKWQEETAVALRKFAADEFPEDGDAND